MINAAITQASITQAHIYQANFSASYFVVLSDQYSTSSSFSTSQSFAASQFQHSSFVDRFSSFISQQEKDRNILREF